MNARESIRQSKLGTVVIATGLLSYSVLTLEIVLTRIFSVMLSYHFVFAVVSFSMLGLGVGGMFLQKWSRWFSGIHSHINATNMALMISIAVVAIIKLPSFESTNMATLAFWVYILLATLPFFFAGLSLAGIFQEFPQHSSILYGADLLGATLGALLVVFLLNSIGAVNAALLTSFSAVIAALLLKNSKDHAQNFYFIAGSGLAAILSLVVWFGVESTVPILRNPDKDMYRMLSDAQFQARVVESRWSAFGRTDLVRSPLPPDFMTIYLDGSAGSPMYNLNAILNDPEQKARITRNFGAYFPFYFLEAEEKNNALIIGSGGGREVVISILGGVKKVIAVEVNPDIVQIVKDYASFNGGIYTNYPGVTVKLAEGRNYIRSNNEKFDLIMLAIPVTKSSRSVEGYALTESYMFTVESMRDYLNHLTPEGRLVLVAHSSTEIFRLITLALSAFEERAISQTTAMTHMYMMASGPLPTLVIKNKPFTYTEIRPRYEKIRELGFDKFFFLPHAQELVAMTNESNGAQGTLDKVLLGLSTGNLKLADLLRASPFDITPVTDDSPFFYKLRHGLPQPFGTFAFLIVVICGALLGLIMVPKTTGTTTKKQISLLAKLRNNPQLKTFLSVFFLLGMAFMLIEIALFQKLTLFLGQPILALTVLLFSLLLGSGLGSFASGLIAQRMGMAIVFSAIVVSCLTIGYALFYDNIFSVGLDAKVIAALILIPLGFAMGFPFPLSIRLMKNSGVGDSIHWMWGLNGVASVLGSALTMIIGMKMGFSYALYLGAAGYLLLAGTVFVYLCQAKAT
ncbi:MAG: hypothetical protein ACE5G1_01385 [bacterium]